MLVGIAIAALLLVTRPGAPVQQPLLVATLTAANGGAAMLTATYDASRAYLDEAL